MNDITILATGLGFPEGPMACADGSIVLANPAPFRPHGAG